MKKIKISSYKALSLIFTLFSTGATLRSAQAPLMVTVQYTKNSTVVPINVNCGGIHITTSTHESGGVAKTTFEIPKSSEQTRFYCLVTSTNVGGKLKTMPEEVTYHNTFEYLAINPAAPYKFYAIDLVKDPILEGTTDPKLPKKPTYHVEIKEEALPETGQIPDRTIIITCDPAWIMNIKGGTQAEFTITLDNSLSEKFESEEKFEEAVIKLQLAALDSNTLHTPMRRKIKTDGRCTRIMESLT
jgi:hypothetical protein